MHYNINRSNDGGVVMKENLEEQGDPLNDSKKLTFDSKLDKNANLIYIKSCNEKFIDNPKLDQKRYDYITNIKVYVDKDVNVLVNRLKNQKQWEDKFGAYCEGDYLFMSSLTIKWFDLINYEKILWDILNAKKALFKVHYSYNDFGNKVADSATLNTGELSNLLTETRRGRSAKIDELIDKLIMKLTESDGNDNDRDNKTVNNDLSDVEDCYFEYVKSEYADRYFFYFSRLRNLSEYVFENVNKEYEKYNVENIKEVESEMKTNKASINKLQKQLTEAELTVNVLSSEISRYDEKSINNSEELKTDLNNLIANNKFITDTNPKISELETKNQELQKILDHPLTKFYQEHKKEIEIVKKEIDDIKESWKQQYCKFMFAYMLERPDEIWKLRHIIEDFGADVQFKFIEFLLKHTDHQNFAYTCYKFDNLLKEKRWLFGEKDQSTKNGLKTKYNEGIKNLGCNTLTVVNSLLSNDKETFLDKHMYKSWALLRWTFDILIFVVIAPILIQLIILPCVCPIIICILLILTVISGIGFFDFGNTIIQSLFKAIDFCYGNLITAGAMYSSTVFAAIFWVAVAAFAIAVIFWAYKGYMHGQFEKNLKRPPKEKDLIKELNQGIINAKKNLMILTNNKNEEKCPALIKQFELNEK